MNITRQLLAATPGRVRSSFDQVLGSRIGKLLERIGIGASKPASGEGLLDLAGALLSLRGRASGASLASAFFGLYEASDMAAFLADNSARIVDMPVVTVRPTVEDIQIVAVGIAALAQQLATR